MEGKQKRNQWLYIIEATLEYLISLLVVGSFLATITKHLGLSDSLTGILSSVVSLGCLFQLLSLTVRQTKVKRIVIILSVINQLLFMLIYAVPIVNLSSKTKIIIFVVLIISAYIIYNFAYPKKISWLMSLVDDKHRGSFTANKEIISLISGMVYSFLMGSLVDHFTEAGKTKTAFFLSAVVIFVLCVLHTLTMCFTSETEPTQTKPQNLMKSLSDLFHDKKILQVSFLFVIHHISTSMAGPFYATYLIGELGLSLKLISAMAILGSISRILVSRFWGSYADKNSFAKMIIWCFSFFALSQICVIFAFPQIGKIMFILYYIFHGITYGGLNSALMNLIFDYAPQEKRADSLAISQAFAGLTGFLTTLAVSPLVSHIQNSGNKIFGISIYAQQFVTVLALIFTLLAILYTKFVILKRRHKK